MACAPQVQFLEPEGDCPGSEVLSYLRTGTQVLDACGRAGEVGIVFGAAPPGVDDTEQIWYKRAGDGTPLYMLVYTNGRWRRSAGYPIGLKAFFNGPLAGNFDSATGKGVVGGEWDGWVIRYSNANKFVIPAESYNGSAWLSAVTGPLLATGGNATVLSSAANTYRAPRAALNVGHANANGNDNVTTWENVLYGTVGTAGSSTLRPADPGNPEPEPTPNIPPYIAFVLIEYQGCNI